MKRGDVYWVNLEPTQGSEIKKVRPCVILSATAINQVRKTVIVVPLSTAAKARPPIAIPITSLSKECVAVCDQIRTIDKSRIKNRETTLSINDMKMLENGLLRVLGLEII